MVSHASGPPGLRRESRGGSEPESESPAVRSPARALPSSGIVRWTLEEIAAASGGTASWSGTPGSAGPVIERISHDTRTLQPGDLFVALRAERDGHAFVGDAVTRGAAAVMVEEEAAVGGVAAVIVEDTGRALLDVGAAARRRLDIPVVGITGSVGKTSTKDMAAAALAAGLRTVSSARSFNNELGVPLTLANAPESCQVAVLEMGARGPGHIALLCRVAAPVTGVVTAVAAAHTEMFGDLDGIARAKGELIESLPASGLAILNGDDGRVREMASRGPAPALLYSASEPPAAGADLVAETITLDDELRPRFVLRSPWGTEEVALEARGAHQVGNALAALAVAASAGVDLADAASALRSAALSPMRMDLRRSRSGAVIIDDSYNANPASMAAALRALAAVPSSRRIAALGAMAELGPNGAQEHLAVTRLADRLGIDVIAVGTAEYGLDPADDVADAIGRIGALGAGDAVLVKASRVAGLDRLAARLLEQ